MVGDVEGQVILEEVAVHGRRPGAPAEPGQVRAQHRAKVVQREQRVVATAGHAAFMRDVGRVRNARPDDRAVRLLSIGAIVTAFFATRPIDPMTRRHASRLVSLSFT